MSNHTNYKACDENTYLLPNFNSAAFEVWEWMNNCLTLYWACDYLSKLELKLIYVSKRGPRSSAVMILTIDKMDLPFSGLSGNFSYLIYVDELYNMQKHYLSSLKG